MTLEEFIKKYDGKGIDYDGKFQTQCVDLYRQYVKEVLGYPQSPPVEGAKDIWETYLPEYFEKIENTPYGVPEKGDIVIWGTGIGKYGHVAIFIEGDAKKFKSFDQNYPVGSLCHIQEHTYKGVLGWLRPRVKKMEIPEWFKTLLQEAGLSLEKEGDFRAFWEKAKKYDQDILSLQEQLKSANETLSEKSIEVSDLITKTQNLQGKVDALEEQLGKTQVERDDYKFRASVASAEAERLQKMVDDIAGKYDALKVDYKKLEDECLKDTPLFRLLGYILRKFLGR